MNSSTLDDHLEALVGDRHEAGVGVRVDHAMLDELGSG
jgi:hypothetical protein